MSVSPDKTQIKRKIKNDGNFVLFACYIVENETLNHAIRMKAYTFPQFIRRNVIHTATRRSAELVIKSILIIININKIMVTRN